MNRVTTARTSPQPAHAYWTMSRGDSVRAFRAARRHSRVVRVLRVAFRRGGAGLHRIFLITYFNPLRMLAKLPVDAGNLVVSGTKITMEKPHLSGFTRDARAYELSADAAKQDLTKPDMIELRNLHAKVQMQDKGTMEVSAAPASMTAKARRSSSTRISCSTRPTGYRGRLSEAPIDIRKGNVVSDHPVEVEMLEGTLDANRLEIVDSGDLVRFYGGVNMTLMLGDAAPSPAKTGVR